jgi:uncharacterized phage protein (predicted DNA packaging)
MEVTLEEAKTYLRVSTGDEDSLIESLISAATKQVQDITRQSDEEFMANEEKALIRIRVAVLYTVGYLYEHREEADHHALTMTLRSLLFGNTGRSVSHEYSSYEGARHLPEKYGHVDKYGNHKTGWTDYFSCWATVGTSSGSESTGVVINPEESLDFTCRYCSELAVWNPQNTGSSRRQDLQHHLCESDGLQAITA